MTPAQGKSQQLRTSQPHAAGVHQRRRAATHEELMAEDVDLLHARQPFQVQGDFLRPRAGPAQA